MYGQRKLIWVSVCVTEHWNALDLGECQRLESFAVTLKVPTARQAASARFPLATACVALFASLPRTIREVVVNAVGLNTLELQDASALRLGLLDDAITEGEKYAGLRKVTLIIENVAHIPKAELESITCVECLYSLLNKEGTNCESLGNVDR